MTDEQRTAFSSPAVGKRMAGLGAALCRAIPAAADDQFDALLALLDQVEPPSAGAAPALG